MDRIATPHVVLATYDEVRKHLIFSSDDIVDLLRGQYPNIPILYSELPRFQAVPETQPTAKANLPVDGRDEVTLENPTSRVILFVGPETLALTNLMITNGNSLVRIDLRTWALSHSIRYIAMTHRPIAALLSQVG